jgi:hypothetical protein
MGGIENGYTRGPKRAATLNEVRRGLLNPPHAIMFPDGLFPPGPPGEELTAEISRCGDQIDAAAQASLDGRLFVVDMVTLVDDWKANYAGASKESLPFDVMAALGPYEDPRSKESGCPLFLFTRHEGNAYRLFTALPVMSWDDVLIWRVPGFFAESSREENARMMLWAIQNRGLKPIGPPR